MLNQPNDRIDEIWNEACNLQKKGMSETEEKHTSSMLSTWKLCLIVGGPIVVLFTFCDLQKVMNGITYKIAGSFILGAIVALIFFYIEMRKEFNKKYRFSPRNPDFYMPYIIRMVGEIMADEWGQYRCTGNEEYENVRILDSWSLRPHKRKLFHCIWDEDKDKPRTVHYGRRKDCDEDGVAIIREEYYVCMGHPVLGAVEQGRKQDHLYRELKEQMQGVANCEYSDLAVFKGMGRWCLYFDAEEFDRMNFRKIGQFNRASWFEFAYRIATRTKSIMVRMEKSMDEIAQ